MKGIVTENGVLLGKAEIIRTNSLGQYTIDGVVFGEWLGIQHIVDDIPSYAKPGAYQLIDGVWTERQDIEMPAAIQQEE